MCQSRKPFKLIAGEAADDLVVSLWRLEPEQGIGAKLTFIDQPGGEPFEREVRN